MWVTVSELRVSGHVTKFKMTGKLEAESWVGQKQSTVEWTLDGCPVEISQEMEFFAMFEDGDGKWPAGSIRKPAELIRILRDAERNRYVLKIHPAITDLKLFQGHIQLIRTQVYRITDKSLK